VFQISCLFNGSYVYNELDLFTLRAKSVGVYCINPIAAHAVKIK